MLALVLGGAASGKSAYAEQLSMLMSQERYYIATMQVYDEESERRVERHRAMRKNKGFATVERSLDLAGLKIPHTGGVALLECASTLIGNELCLSGGAGTLAAAAIMDGIDSLLQDGLDLVVVSNDVFGEGGNYSPEMQTYLEQLGRLNCAVAARADVVVEVVCGLPVCHKGKDLLKGLGKL